MDLTLASALSGRAVTGSVRIDNDERIAVRCIFGIGTVRTIEGLSASVSNNCSFLVKVDCFAVTISSPVLGDKNAFTTLLR
jgi:hypothetical protein